MTVRLELITYARSEMRRAFTQGSGDAIPSSMKGA